MLSVVFDNHVAGTVAGSVPQDGHDGSLVRTLLFGYNAILTPEPSSYGHGSCGGAVRYFEYPGRDVALLGVARCYIAVGSTLFGTIDYGSQPQPSTLCRVCRRLSDMCGCDDVDLKREVG